MNFTKKVVVIILTICILCTSMPTYALGELVNSEPGIETQTKSENETKTEIESKTEPEQEPEIQVTPSIKPSTEPETEVTTEPTTEPTVEPETDSETEPKTEPEIEKETEQKTETKSKENDNIGEEENPGIDKNKEVITNNEEKESQEIEENFELPIQQNSILNKRRSLIANLSRNVKTVGWDNALHFIIRHWHSAKIIKDQEHEEIENGQNFVVIEGYIVPQDEGYEFYIINPETRS